MSWLISFVIVIILLSILTGIAFLIDKFDMVLGWFYLMLFSLCIGILTLLTIAVHQILF